MAQTEKKKKKQTHTLWVFTSYNFKPSSFCFRPAGASSSTVSSSRFWNRHPFRGITRFSLKRAVRVAQPAAVSSITAATGRAVTTRTQMESSRFLFSLLLPSFSLSLSLQIYTTSTPPLGPACACRLSNRALSPPRHHYTEPAQSGYRRPGHGWLHHRGPRLNLLYICPHDAPRSGAEPCMSGPHWIRWIILRSLFYTFLGFRPLRPPCSSSGVKAPMFRLNAPVAFFSLSSLRSC